ncbi:HEPN domain-containing protein [Sinorhizobium sp. GL28]|uniref:HEPN domain-containing protein n=1 Tax=Sinorhizobium sp. GL28 TaxID=1358418 RepID=UPI00071D0AE7|nr:HEPN domain-containing protein [Sinorhizobium sp. GL28]KSV91558.1 hypothetical protein N184_24900 [Sinorhizobium sp. GL28]
MEWPLRVDSEPLVEPRTLGRDQLLKLAQEHFQHRFPSAQRALISAVSNKSKIADDIEWSKDTAFALHQAVEQAYSSVLLTLKNYGPPSHNLRFLRGLAEELDRRLVEAWPNDQQRFVSWFNTINEAYVKARYSKHYQISEEALSFLVERMQVLHALVKTVCEDHLARLGDETQDKL